MRDSLKRTIYLLTVWQERPASSGRAAVWRYSLENVRTGQKRGFTSLEEISNFIQNHVIVEDYPNGRTTK